MFEQLVRLEAILLRCQPSFKLLRISVAQERDQYFSLHQQLFNIERTGSLGTGIAFASKPNSLIVRDEFTAAAYEVVNTYLTGLRPCRWKHIFFTHRLLCCALFNQTRSVWVEEIQEPAVVDLVPLTRAYKDAPTTRVLISSWLSNFPKSFLLKILEQNLPTGIGLRQLQQPNPLLRKLVCSANRLPVFENDSSFIKDFGTKSADWNWVAAAAATQSLIKRTIVFGAFGDNGGRITASLKRF